MLDVKARPEYISLAVTLCCGNARILPFPWNILSGKRCLFISPPTRNSKFTLYYLKAFYSLFWPWRFESFEALTLLMLSQRCILIFSSLSQRVFDSIYIKVCNLPVLLQLYICIYIYLCISIYIKERPKTHWWRDFFKMADPPSLSVIFWVRGCSYITLSRAY